MRDMATEIAIRWGKEGSETIDVFFEDKQEVIYTKDPRFAPLAAVLDWIPHDDVYGDKERKELSYYIRWWNHIPLDTIGHLVKKTEEDGKDKTESK